MRKDAAAVEFLLAKGADPKLSNQAGASVATHSDWPRILKHLEAAAQVP